MSGSHPLGMAEFFALEAGEYLERLDTLLGGAGAPAAEEFVRLARALRGSALMASQPAVGRAAAGLEALARAVREGRRGWDADLHQTAVRAVDDLKKLVRRAGQWTDADTRGAEALANQLEQIAGRPSAQVRAVEALGLDAGARAFIAREGAAIASALDRAAQMLRADTRSDPIPTVRRAIEPLRGLAALNDLPPLGDLLEGVEQALGHAPRAGRSTAELFAAGATAVSQAAREVAERGRPDPDSPAFRRFAGLLVRVLDAEGDVVPIESLFYSDGGPTLVQRGVAPAAPAGLGRLELVSHGEHLRQAADLLERAPSATQRELRAHTLAGTFRTLTTASGSELGAAVAAFAKAARDALLRGVAVGAPAAFAAELRQAGDVLSQAAAGEEATLARRLASVTKALSGIPAPATPPVRAHAPEPRPAVAPRPTPVPAPEPERAPEPAAPAPARPSAEATAPAPAAAPPTAPPTPATPAVPEPPSPPPAPPPPASVVPDLEETVEALEGSDELVDFDETPDFVGSWLRYERLLKEGDSTPGSLDELLQTAAAPTPAAIAALPLVEPEVESEAAPAAQPVVDIAALAPDESPVVAIDTLLYRGARAAARAQELREEARTASPERLRALVEEVCDLVALASADGP